MNEIICDHQSESGPVVTHVRGALLASSLQIIKDVGLYPRYLEALAAEYREQVLFALAMSWIPIDVAMAHYRACDVAAPSGAEMQKIADGLSKRYADTIHGSMLRAARAAGLDEGPWVALRAQGRIWDRTYQGGGVRAYRTGLKDGLMEEVGLPLAKIPYFRSAHLLWLKTIAELVVKKVHIRIVPPRDGSQMTLAFSASWV